MSDADRGAAAVDLKKYKRENKENKQKKTAQNGLTCN
jgi:hypothetical protein